MLLEKGRKYEDGVWTNIQDPPVNTELSQFAVIFDAGNFYYFGGYDRGVINSILRLNEATWTWSRVGNLNSARWHHGVILIENTFMVIGGDGTHPNEACFLENGQFTCEEKTSILEKYKTPVLFPVSNNFGPC